MVRSRLAVILDKKELATKVQLFLAKATGMSRMDRTAVAVKERLVDR